MQTTCPIWGTPAEELPRMGDRRELVSGRAGGRYAISGTAEALWPSLDDQRRDRLTQWLADQRRAGNECPLITSEVLSAVG